MRYLNNFKVLALALVLCVVSGVSSSDVLPLRETIARFGKDIHEKQFDISLDENVAHSPMNGFLALTMLMQVTDGYSKSEMCNKFCFAEDDLSALKNIQNKLPIHDELIWGSIHFDSKLYVGSDAKEGSDYKEIVKKNFPRSNKYLDPKKSVQTIVYTNKDKLLYSNMFIEEKYDTLISSKVINQFFHCSENEIIKVTMLQKEEVMNYAKVPELDAEYLEIPYENKDIKLIIILPSQNNTLSNLSMKLRTFNYEKINTKSAYVNLFLPRINIEKEIIYRPTLEKLGITDMFTDKANLKIQSQAPLKVDKIVQKIKLNLSTGGINYETGANTRKYSDGYGFKPQYGDFNVLANRPFYFAIKSVLYGTLIEGHLVNPLLNVD